MGNMSHMNKNNNASNYTTRANLSFLNTRQLRKLHKLKYLTFKFNPYTKELITSTIYKNITSNDKKIIFFDALLSYELDQDGNMKNAFYNIYIPTIYLNYVEFVYKNSILSKPADIELLDLPKLEKEIYMIFATQNKFYAYEDYKAIKKEYNITSESDYKFRIKALHDYITKKQAIPGFYFFLAVMYDIIPLKYMGKCKIESNKKTDYKNIFFVEPEEDSK